MPIGTVRSNHTDLQPHGCIYCNGCSSIQNGKVKKLYIFYLVIFDEVRGHLAHWRRRSVPAGPITTEFARNIIKATEKYPCQNK